MVLTGRRHVDRTGYAANRTGCGSKWLRYTNKMLWVPDGSIRDCLKVLSCGVGPLVNTCPCALRAEYIGQELRVR